MDINAMKKIIILLVIIFFLNTGCDNKINDADYDIINLALAQSIQKNETDFSENITNKKIYRLFYNLSK